MTSSRWPTAIRGRSGWSTRADAAAQRVDDVGHDLARGDGLADASRQAVDDAGGRRAHGERRRAALELRGGAFAEREAGDGPAKPLDARARGAEAVLRRVPRPLVLLRRGLRDRAAREQPRVRLRDLAQVRLLPLRLAELGAGALELGRESERLRAGVERLLREVGRFEHEEQVPRLHPVALGGDQARDRAGLLGAQLAAGGRLERAVAADRNDEVTLAHGRRLDDRAPRPGERQDEHEPDGESGEGEQPSDPAGPRTDVGVVTHEAIVWRGVRGTGFGSA